MFTLPQCLSKNGINKMRKRCVQWDISKAGNLDEVSSNRSSHLGPNDWNII